MFPHFTPAPGKTIGADQLSLLSAQLKKHFGFTSFNPLQPEIIQSTLDGHNVVGVLGTGGGKSLCYQLPAVLSPGVTIVVTPTIALMNDQVNNLKKRNIPAVRLHSGCDTAEKEENWRLIHAGETKLIYVSPEQLVTPRFLRLMQGVTVSHLVIDEAHLISTWGESFRPDYLQLPKVHQALGSPPIAAYTATATVTIIEDIITRLEINDCKLFQGEIDRPEIELRVEKYAWYEDKLRALISALEDAQETGSPTIVYSSRISTLLELETALSEHDIRVGVYHGRMDAGYREVIERHFIAGECKILLATKAFGMGIDKEDVRNIIHFDPPDSLDAYWQEVGRAGRDRQPSSARLFFTTADFRRLDKVLYNSIPDLNLILKVYDWLWNPMSENQKQGFLPTRFF